MSEIILYTIIAAFAVIGGWLVFLTVKYKKIARKAEIIFSEKVPKSLPVLLDKYLLEVRRVEGNNTELERKLKAVEKMAADGLYKIGFVRYNPFGDVGGNQSFSLALLNKGENGFVISSIHSREGTRVYSKTVRQGGSEYNLSEEEKKAILIAKGGRGEKNV